MRNLDLKDISTPVEEVRRYLLAKYDQRLKASPKLFEDVVGSVFSSIGFDVEVTAYSGDNGIDVFLRQGESQIGVQVKRTKNAIEVEQIRALTGALVLHGITRGVFVTTSRFRSGAHSHVATYGSRGYQIELLDAEKFFELMKLAQQPMYEAIEDFPIEACHVKMGLVSADYINEIFGNRGFYG